jgi:hypothetical protein
MAGVVLVPAVVSVVPGGEGSCTVRVRNTGQVVDSYTITVLGAPAAWSTPMPAVLSLFPGAEGEAVVSFRPPRSPELTAGPLDFAVRVVPTEDADGSVVEEGTLTVDAFHDLSARITPRTSETKRAARHTVTVDNRGNAPLTVELAATDPDDQLAFGIQPPTLTIPPGQTGTANIKAAAPRGFARGPDRHRPFQAAVTPTGNAGSQPPTLLDATLVQRSGLPRFVPALIAAVVLVALAAVLIPILANKGSDGSITLTGADQAATTTVPAAGGAGDDQAAADAEAEANANEAKAPTTTNPPNRQGTSTGAAGAGTAAAGGGTATTVAPTATTDAPGPTTPDAKPVTTTTQPGATTTAPPTVASQGTAIIHGTYSFDFDSGKEQSSGADAFWNQQSSTNRALIPSGGAMFSNLGPANFDALTYAQLKSASYSTAAIDGSDGHDQMPVGTVIAIKTNAGKWAKVRIEARNVSDPAVYSIQNIRVRWVTYN